MQFTVDVRPAASRRAFWLHGCAWELPTFENADVFVNRLICQEIIVRDPAVTAALQGHTPAQIQITSKRLAGRLRFFPRRRACVGLG